MRAWKQLLNSREVPPILAIHPTRHQCRSSRILCEELRFAEHPRRDRRRLAQEFDHRFRMNGRRIRLRYLTLSVFRLSSRLLHRPMKKMLTGHA
jgi:hypothetical protein